MQVNWTISQAISVTEGDTVVLRAEVFGVYAFPIAIGVKTIATDVQPGMDTIPGTDSACYSYNYINITCK